MAESKNSGKLGVAYVVLVVGFLVVAPTIWQQVRDAGWVPHNSLAIVTAKNWSAGEYKTCTEPNIEAMKEEPQIDCSGSGFGESGEPKRFKVLFYGATYQEELKNNSSLVWRCHKNEGTDPTFTCDDQKIVQWENPSKR